MLGLSYCTPGAKRKGGRGERNGAAAKRWLFKCSSPSATITISCNVAHRPCLGYTTLLSWNLVFVYEMSWLKVFFKHTRTSFHYLDIATLSYKTWKWEEPMMSYMIFDLHCSFGTYFLDWRSVFPSPYFGMLVGVRSLLLPIVSGG